MNRYAVIDVGTNTFHLLIAEQGPTGKMVELDRERRYVRLGEEGLETIGKKAYDRGILTLEEFKSMLDEYEVNIVRAFGTAALRTASNGPAFVREVEERTGIRIQMIDGDKEALLIHLGVTQAIPAFSQRALIMDIGGGSVEFILCDDDQVFWEKSFPIGVAVLYKKFHHTDPISVVEVESVRGHLAETLTPLREAIQQYPATLLIGASGTFDVLEVALKAERVNPHHTRFSVEVFNPYYRKLLPSTLRERLAMPEVPAERADLIIVALILVDYVLNLAPFREVLVSSYAMKEGMMAELMREPVFKNPVRKGP